MFNPNSNDIVTDANVLRFSTAKEVQTREDLKDFIADWVRSIRNVIPESIPESNWREALFEYVRNPLTIGDPGTLYIISELKKLAFVIVLDDGRVVKVHAEKSDRKTFGILRYTETGPHYDPVGLIDRTNPNRIQYLFNISEINSLVACAQVEWRLTTIIKYTGNLRETHNPCYGIMFNVHEPLGEVKSLYAAIAVALHGGEGDSVIQMWANQYKYGTLMNAIKDPEKISDQQLHTYFRTTNREQITSSLIPPNVLPPVKVLDILGHNNEIRQIMTCVGDPLIEPDLPITNVPTLVAVPGASTTTHLFCPGVTGIEMMLPEYQETDTQFISVAFMLHGPNNLRNDVIKYRLTLYDFITNDASRDFIFDMWNFYDFRRPPKVYIAEANGVGVSAEDRKKISYHYLDHRNEGDGSTLVALSYITDSNRQLTEPIEDSVFRHLSKFAILIFSGAVQNQNSSNSEFNIDDFLQSPPSTQGPSSPIAPVENRPTLPFTTNAASSVDATSPTPFPPLTATPTSTSPIQNIEPLAQDRPIAPQINPSQSSNSTQTSQPTSVGAFNPMPVRDTVHNMDIDGSTTSPEQTAQATRIDKTIVRARDHSHVRSMIVRARDQSHLKNMIVRVYIRDKGFSYKKGSDRGLASKIFQNPLSSGPADQLEKKKRQVHKSDSITLVNGVRLYSHSRGIFFVEVGHDDVGQIVLHLVSKELDRNEVHSAYMKSSTDGSVDIEGLGCIATKLDHEIGIVEIPLVLVKPRREMSSNPVLESRLKIMLLATLAFTNGTKGSKTSYAPSGFVYYLESRTPNRLQLSNVLVICQFERNGDTFTLKTDVDSDENQVQSTDHSWQSKLMKAIPWTKGLAMMCNLNGERNGQPKKNNSEDKQERKFPTTKPKKKPLK
ncbi:hypothetical protein M427DRAFT_50206 [Gonapodya prolifera JEL478]|uniref:Uncharacterized protein n=1 Tax=Gonapodya prolifera (strain JEL478) TaxID=1344416 RepID=A0A138ZWL2_GONPJ|nr:hypothetical protein M427DRAFT_50206 [Gonapodya prolifera JEL478]|eukprot:KXS08910.1 hypothetical protein M427DRAFT_50206 [Gonapodya prolifera JEL478]